MIEVHRQAYIDEAAELLSELEVSLLELEEKPEDAELIGRVFRSLHTIKGSGAMFGFDSIASFTHQVETVFDGVREGRVPVTPELVGVTLDARDHIQSLLRDTGSNEEMTGAADRILERLREAAPDCERAPEPASKPATSQPPPAPDGSAAVHSYRIHFEPDPDIFLTGTNPVLLLRELAALGDCSLIAHTARIPQLDSLNCEECCTYWDIVVTTAAGENAIHDVFIFVEDRARLTVTCLPDVEERRRLGEILAAHGDAPSDAIEEVLNRPLAGELLVQAGLVSQDRVDAAVLEQQHLESLRDKRQKAEASSTLRVSADKLDSLVNIVGELVTVQARLTGYAVASGSPEANCIAEEVERLTERLRETTMSVRMLPIRDTFSRFKRLVRDLSAELGKKVELTSEGDDTELDKTVIEQLSDPLVHLIRNAVDHGVEQPEQRLAAGKPALGRIHLSAGHAGAFVQIRVSDDGAGMNRAAIRARAVQRGMIAADAVMSDQEILALVLKPGFSTAEHVTEVSGRGVGMDVVQRSLDALRGTLSITSEPGHGSAVTLKIPLTLAIIDGLLVEAGGASYVVPLSNISECIELVRSAENSSSRRKLVAVREELIPYIVLRERFALPGLSPGIEQVIVAETREGKCGFVVDRVVGDHHTVIKKLGHLYRHVEEVSGATILGDGTVALILDVDKLAGEVVRESLRR